MSERIANVWRGELIESTHEGDVAVVDNTGKLLWYAGDPTRVTYARSSAKPLQALPLLETGALHHFGITDEELALVCASHNGETYHTELALGLLEKIGVGPDKLLCGVHAPYHTPAYEALLREGTELTAIHNNCSGKHSGMLALASYLNTDLDTYLERTHPIQQLIVQTISDICAYPKRDIKIGTDGCGVPVFGMPIQNLALGFAKLAQPTGFDDKRSQGLTQIRDAMMKYPFAVAGTDRFCTDLMAAAPGQVVAKVGAEGVYCVGLPERGWGLCVKASDGSNRGLYPAVVEVLKQMDVLTDDVLDQLERYWHPEIRNHQGTLVGKVEPVVNLQTA